MLTRRGVLLVGVGSMIRAPKTVFAQADTVIHDWRTGGGDPLRVADRHDFFMRQAVAAGIYTPEQARAFYAMATSGRRQYSEDILQDGQMFEAMGFGAGKILRNVRVNLAHWSPSASREYITYFLDVETGMTRGTLLHRASFEERDFAQRRTETLTYCVPRVCGNSSAAAYKAGKPVCVPLPARGTYRTI